MFVFILSWMKLFVKLYFKLDVVIKIFEYWLCLHFQKFDPIRPWHLIELISFYFWWLVGLINFCCKILLSVSFWKTISEVDIGMIGKCVNVLLLTSPKLSRIIPSFCEVHRNGNPKSITNWFYDSSMNYMFREKYLRILSVSQMI